MHLIGLLVQYPQSTRVFPIVDHLRAVRRHVPVVFALIAVFLILFCALAASGAQAVTVGNDPETTATDPNAARAAKLQSASDSLEGLHFVQAIERAREVLATAKDSLEITRAEEIILDATRYQSGCKAALDEAKRMLSQAKQLRPDNSDEIGMIEERTAEFQDEVETYSKALEAQKEIKSANPGTAQAMDATYRIARLMCYYGGQGDAVYALSQLIDESAKSDGQIGTRDGSAAVGEAVSTLKKLCLTRSGPDEAVRQLEEVAASHILDDAGAHAWNCIGDVYRSQGKTDLAEEAYLTVDRMYASSPVRYTAMMGAGDMYDDIAHVHEDAGRKEAAIEAWKRACEFYPDERRRCETHHVIAAFYLQLNEYSYACTHLQVVLDTKSPELAPLRDEIAYKQAYVLFLLGRYQEALEGFQSALAHLSDEEQRRVCKGYIEAARMMLPKE